MLIKNQQGVGLLEVLVALLLLAVAVLGFSAMQLRSIQATDETLTRSDAMVIIRNISEDLRLLATEDQKYNYQVALQDLKGKQLSELKTLSKACDKKPCDFKNRVEANAAQSLVLAKSSNIQVNSDFCPVDNGEKNVKKLCLIASWNETTADMDGKEKSCAKPDGTYIAGSTCVIMETY